MSRGEEAGREREETENKVGGTGYSDALELLGFVATKAQSISAGASGSSDDDTSDQPDDDTSNQPEDDVIGEAQDGPQQLADDVSRACDRQKAALADPSLIDTYTHEDMRRHQLMDDVLRPRFHARQRDLYLGEGFSNDETYNKEWMQPNRMIVCATPERLRQKTISKIQPHMRTSSMFGDIIDKQRPHIVVAHKKHYALCLSFTTCSGTNGRYKGDDFHASHVRVFRAGKQADYPLDPDHPEFPLFIADWDDIKDGELMCLDVCKVYYTDRVKPIEGRLIRDSIIDLSVYLLYSHVQLKTGLLRATHIQVGKLQPRFERHIQMRKGRKQAGDLRWLENSAYDMLFNCTTTSERLAASKEENMKEGYDTALAMMADDREKAFEALKQHMKEEAEAKVQEAWERDVDDQVYDADEAGKVLAWNEYCRGRDHGEDERQDLRSENGDLKHDNADLVSENGDLKHDNADLIFENGNLKHDKADLIFENGNLKLDKAGLIAENEGLRRQVEELQRRFGPDRRMPFGGSDSQQQRGGGQRELFPSDHGASSVSDRDRGSSGGRNQRRADGRRNAPADMVAADFQSRYREINAGVLEDEQDVEDERQPKRQRLNPEDEERHTLLTKEFEHTRFRGSGSGRGGSGKRMR